MVASFGVSVSAYAIGQTANPLVTFIDEYQNDTPNEGQSKTTGNYDVNGTSAEADLVWHMVIAAYSFFVMAAISIGGYVFMLNFLGFDDNFECDLQEDTITAATYAAVLPIIEAQTDRASCLKTIQQVFDIEDLNKDGFITRCEDATLQHAFGATKEYAYKFSSSFSRASFNKICSENFPQ